MVSKNLVNSVSHDCTEDQGAGAGDNRGIDLFRRSVYSSPSSNAVAKELQWFFGTANVNRPPKLVASYDSTTLALIKPHALQAGRDQGFQDPSNTICTVNIHLFFIFCRSFSGHYFRDYHKWFHNHRTKDV